MERRWPWWGPTGPGSPPCCCSSTAACCRQSGRVRIGEMPVTKKTLAHVRRTVGLVFQDPDDQLFMPLVFDDVAFGPLNLGLSPEEVERQVIQALAAVGAVHLKDRPPYHLSGGEKRAVAIATVLSLSPAILVMDEPSSNLDPKTRRQLIELLKTFDHTLIIATHDLDLVLDLCPRTVVLKEGLHRRGRPHAGDHAGRGTVGLLPPGEAPPAARLPRVHPGLIRASGLRLDGGRLRRVRYSAAINFPLEAQIPLTPFSRGTLTAIPHSSPFIKGRGFVATRIGKNFWQSL